MATYKAVILKGKFDTKGDGTTNIKIRITHQAKINYIATDLFVHTLDFDNKQGLAKKGPNQRFINLRIAGYLKKYREKDMELGDRIEYMAVSDIKKYILTGKSSSKQIDFFEFVDEFITTVRVNGTAGQYRFLVLSLKQFIGDKLPVSEITLNFLFRYEAYLRSRNVQNGIVNYMTTFRSLFNKCRDHYNDEDTGKILIPQYPFRKYKIPVRKTKSRDHILTLDELELFKNYKSEIKGETLAKDMFLLMFYLIGIEAKDLFYLRKPINGRISYDRFKTGKEYSIKLEPEAVEIIKRYKGDKFLLNVSDRFQLHSSFVHYINRYLHGEKYHNITGICTKLGIPKNVTTKWSRHTWATIARNECKINKDDVALCLGHEDADNQVTDLYVKYDYRIIDESNRKVLNVISM